MTTSTVHLRLQIPTNLAGQRLDQALAQLLPDYSRSRLKTWIDAGEVLVDGVVSRPKDKLNGGESIEVAATLTEETAAEAQAIPLAMVHEDKHVYIVNKPPGLVVHPGAGNPDRTLQNALLSRDPQLAGLPRAGIVHRLDKDTSGLLIVARTIKAHTALVRMLEARDIHREYEAITRGVMTAGGTIDAPIDRHPTDRVRMAIRQGGRDAVTHYRVIKRYRAHTHVRVQLDVLFTIPLFVLYQLIVDNIGISLVMTLIMIVAGFVFTSVSAYMAGLVGSSNNPVSGITICTILFASLLLVALMGRGAALGPVAAIMIGSVVCCAACIGGDNLQDLKAGQLVGATPWRQQVMLAIGAVSCALVMAPVLNLLLKAYGIGAPTLEHPNALIAPQATLMASVAKGMFGGDLPWGMISIGALIGACIIVFDEYLKRSKAPFRAPVLAVAVGIYLPLELSVPIFCGGLIAHLVERRLGIRDDSPAAERAKQGGILFAAGLITGEALMGIFIAIPIVMSGRADVLALGSGLQFGEGTGLAVVAALAFALYRAGAARRA